MFNTAFKSYQNLPLPSSKNTKQEAVSTGLLSRGPRPKNKNGDSELSPRQRVAKYVMEIREGRQELKND